MFNDALENYLISNFFQAILKAKHSLDEVKEEREKMLEEPTLPTE